MTAKYFAYGSNLDLLQMKRRCPLSKLISKGKLPDYRLTFNRYAEGWDGGVADVIPVSYTHLTLPTSDLV